MAMDVAGGAVQESFTWIPTLIEWRLPAKDVQILGSWDAFQEGTKLECHSHSDFSIVKNLQPGQYRFWYVVDGIYTCDPYRHPQVVENGTSYNVLDVDERNGVPTLIEWSGSAMEVAIFGRWNGYERTVLNNYGHRHAIWLLLHPGEYLFHYQVDGIDKHNPFLSWQGCEDGRNYNFLSVKMPLTIPEPEWVLVPISLTLKCDLAQVSGSWDNWKSRLPMRHNGNDHYLQLSLHPGVYYLKYFVDGEEFVKEDTESLRNDQGYVLANIVNAVLPPRHYLDGITGASLLDDFISLTGKQLLTDVKFNVGSEFGSIDKMAKAYPCTEFGYMLLGFLGFVKQTYVRGYSWGGCFGSKDMVIIDGSHCQIKAPAKLPLKRANIILDGIQLRNCLLSRYWKDGSYPPYFDSLLSYLEDPPADLDTNAESKAMFLDLYDNQAALATPPRRMLVLINMAQFFKQLPEAIKSKFAQDFLPLLVEYANWRTTACEDALLRGIFLHRRGKSAQNDDADLVPNTSLEMINFLRVFFVHGPEHTLEDELQLLKAYTEFDLIIAHYYEKAFSELVKLIRKLVDKHVLIRAMWDFYCGGCPPDHYQE